MSARDKDARAAMLLMLRSDTRGSNASAERTQEGTPEDARVHALQRGLARHAWLIADAMEAERAKRDQAEAPEMPEPAPVRDDDRAKIKEACEKARREGRDAGLAEAIQVVARRRFHSDFPRDERTLQDAWEAISALLDKAEKDQP